MSDPTAFPATGTILVVDDKSSNLDAIVDRLEAHGNRVLLTSDGTSALKLAASAQPDLILLDVRSPRVDGNEISRGLKQGLCTRDIIVIFMITLTSEEERLAVFAAGGTDYVTKPLNADEVLARVTAHLSVRLIRKQLGIQQSHQLPAKNPKGETGTSLLGARDELERRVMLRIQELAHANSNLRTQMKDHCRMLARLRTSERRFRAVVRSMPTALCIASIPDGQVLYTNRSLCELFGIRKGTCRNITDFHVNPVDFERSIGRLCAEGRPCNIEAQFKRTDGTRFWAAGTACIASYDGAAAIYIGLTEITDQKRVEQELVELRERERELYAYMETAREEERKRTATEINNELGQLLTALKMDVSLLKMHVVNDVEVTKKADDMRELVEGTIWMTRDIASRLRPTALNFGIVSALEWLVQDFNRRSNIVCGLRIDGKEPTLSDAHATVVFRIAQATLTDMTRYTNPTRIDVVMKSTASTLELHVREDSAGFDWHAAHLDLSYDLLYMDQRAKLLGGSLVVQCSPEGATFSISMPLNGVQQI